MTLKAELRQALREAMSYRLEADALRDEVARWRKEAAEQGEIAHKLRVALEAAVGRMEAVSTGIPVNMRADGVSQATHVAHMARHLAQHAKIARAALAGEAVVVEQADMYHSMNAD